MEKQSFHVKCERYAKLYTTQAYAWSGNTDPPSAPEKLVCLFDTGADVGLINTEVARRIGIHPTGFMELFYTSGEETFADIYKVDVCLPGGMVFKNHSFRGTNAPIDIMVGMDIMTLGEMSFRYQDPYLEMSFISDKYDLYLPDLGDGLGVKF